MNKNRASESGSIIYWIFIAVAMFAALSFTVARISREGNTKMSEVARMRATDIIQYAYSVHSGVKIMRINGIDESELCFHDGGWGHNDYEFNPQCSSNGNRVFSREGGSVGFQDGVADWYTISGAEPADDSKTWIFSSRYEITDVGTDSGGAGTDGDNADLVMATAPVRDDVCEQINLLLGYDPGTPPGVAASTYDTMAGEEFVGTFSNGTGRIASNSRERCVNDPDGFNMYYKVILAR